MNVSVTHYATPTMTVFKALIPHETLRNIRLCSITCSTGFLSFLRNKHSSVISSIRICYLPNRHANRWFLLGQLAACSTAEKSNRFNEVTNTKLLLTAMECYENVQKKVGGER